MVIVVHQTEMDSAGVGAGRFRFQLPREDSGRMANRTLSIMTPEWWCTLHNAHCTALAVARGCPLRERRPPSSEPGPWIASTSSGHVLQCTMAHLAACDVM